METKSPPPPPPSKRVVYLRKKVKGNSKNAGHLIKIQAHPNDLLQDIIPVMPRRSKQVLLTYSEAASITSGAASAGTYVYSANGLYDPNITSTGHQPMGFDQMMLWYEHYTVLRSACVVRFKNFSATYPAYVAISKNASATPVTNYDQLQEDGTIVVGVCSPKYETGYLRKLESKMDISAFSGVPNLLDEADMRGSSAANPAEQEYFHLSVWNPDDTTTVSTNFTVQMMYEVVFSEPRKLTQS